LAGSGAFACLAIVRDVGFELFRGFDFFLLAALDVSAQRFGTLAQ
jgi:hypothetical protein